MSIFQQIFAVILNLLNLITPKTTHTEAQILQQHHTQHEQIAQSHDSTLKKQAIQKDEALITEAEKDANRILELERKGVQLMEKVDSIEHEIVAIKGKSSPQIESFEKVLADVESQTKSDENAQLHLIETLDKEIADEKVEDKLITEEENEKTEESMAIEQTMQTIAKAQPERDSSPEKVKEFNSFKQAQINAFSALEKEMKSNIGMRLINFKRTGEETHKQWVQRTTPLSRNIPQLDSVVFSTKKIENLEAQEAEHEKAIANEEQTEFKLEEEERSIEKDLFK